MRARAGVSLGLGRGGGVPATGPRPRRAGTEVPPAGGPAGPHFSGDVERSRPDRRPRGPGIGVESVGDLVERSDPVPVECTFPQLRDHPVAPGEGLGERDRRPVQRPGEVLRRVAGAGVAPVDHAGERVVAGEEVPGSEVAVDHDVGRGAGEPPEQGPRRGPGGPRQERDDVVGEPVQCGQAQPAPSRSRPAGLCRRPRRRAPRAAPGGTPPARARARPPRCTSGSPASACRTTSGSSPTTSGTGTGSGSRGEPRQQPRLGPHPRLHVRPPGGALVDRSSTITALLSHPPGISTRATSAASPAGSPSARSDGSIVRRPR
ncbi:MAG: hypothetical protein JWR58_6970 [Pseudonocardia sp.]|nr:hypothetical protein [Pseudonocardia sp.]